jgi:hypothetical protein
MRFPRYWFLAPFGPFSFVLFQFFGTFANFSKIPTPPNSPSLAGWVYGINGPDQRSGALQCPGTRACAAITAKHPRCFCRDTNLSQREYGGIFHFRFGALARCPCCLRALDNTRNGALMFEQDDGLDNLRIGFAAVLAPTAKWAAGGIARDVNNLVAGYLGRVSPPPPECPATLPPAKMLVCGWCAGVGVQMSQFPSACWPCHYQRVMQIPMFNAWAY